MGVLKKPKDVNVNKKVGLDNTLVNWAEKNCLYGTQVVCTKTQACWYCKRSLTFKTQVLFNRLFWAQFNMGKQALSDFK